MKVDAMYYRASYEKPRKIWQKGWFSQAIAGHARGFHSHEELLFDYAVIAEYIEMYNLDEDEIHNLPDTLHEAYQNNACVCFSSSERDGGVRFKDYGEVYANPEKWDILGVTNDLSKGAEMLSFCLKQDGKKYDWAGVAGFKLSFIREQQDKWYCSEICDFAKYLMGLYPAFYRSHPSDSYRIQLYLSRTSS